MKRCVLHADKTCNDCGECDDRCELDPQKICDNCFRCLETDSRPFLDIPISGVFLEDDYSPEGDISSKVDLDDAYVLDSDESWKNGAMFIVKTLPFSYCASRVRRKHNKNVD